METQDWLLLGITAAAAYFILNRNNFGGQNADLPGAPSGYSGSIEQQKPSQQIFTSSTQQIQPVSAAPSIIFTPTREFAADRFIVAPLSNNAGVYDRFAQQSIRKETAVIRSLFGTPGYSK